MRDPQTDEEWREAVDLAHVALAMSAARHYGLLYGGPTINVARCLRILEAGRTRGVTPAADAMQRLLPAFAGAARC